MEYRSASARTRRAATMAFGDAPRFCVGRKRAGIRKTVTLCRRLVRAFLYYIAAFAMNARRLRVTLGSAKSAAVSWVISKAYRGHAARTLHVRITCGRQRANGGCWLAWCCRAYILAATGKTTSSIGTSSRTAATWYCTRSVQPTTSPGMSLACTSTMIRCLTPRLSSRRLVRPGTIRLGHPIAATRVAGSRRITKLRLHAAYQ